MTQLIQDNVINTYAYDNANRTIKYHTTKDEQTISERIYQFDGNGNVIKESINGKENQYTYNENDELKTSSKNIDGEQVVTTYSIDMYGNRVEKRDNGTYSISQYNDKNQLTKIDSEEGSTYLHYDEIGNIASIYYDDGFMEHYAYDDYGQLTQIKNNEDKIIEYTYDGTGERITSTLKDEETYQVKSYYTTQDKLDLTQLREELTQENIDATFDAVAKQAEVKQANGNKCTVTTNHYTVEEYKNRDAYTEYVVDYSQEFSQVLMENADTSVYGLTRLETEDTKYISGLNETVTQTITSNKVTSIEYDDYGYTKDNQKGYGYNGEQKDPTGLIYLRARYYNPKLGRFIQIDPYKGNDTTLASKNRYTFVYNNPYKYVDKSGNEPLDGDDDWWKPKPKTGVSAVKNKVLNTVNEVLKKGNGDIYSGTQNNLGMHDIETRNEKKSSSDILSNGTINPLTKVSKPPIPCPPVIDFDDKEALYEMGINADNYNIYEYSILKGFISGSMSTGSSLVSQIDNLFGTGISFGDLLSDIPDGTDKTSSLPLYTSKILNKGSKHFEAPPNYNLSTVPRKPPNANDISSWILKSVFIVGRDRIENELDLPIFVASVTTFAAGLFVGGFAGAAITVGDILFSTSAGGVIIKDEVAYGLRYVFLDGYYCSMKFTLYVSNDGLVLGKSASEISVDSIYWKG